MVHFDKLVEIMDRLRSPEGCPWDLKQTHQTLKPYLIEEAYEVLDAIDSRDDRALREELGDVLLQVVFHAQIAREGGRFTIDDVAAAISEKLIRRHPHVFGDTTVDGAHQVVENWEAIKSREQRQKGQQGSALEGVPRHLPALLRARRIQEKAVRVGFKWADSDEVAQKVREEVAEFLDAQASGDSARIEAELGDVLFALVNLAGFLHICPEEALHKTIEKFQNRFRFIEAELKKQGKRPQTATLEEMDLLWEKSKEAGNEESENGEG